MQRAVSVARGVVSRDPEAAPRTFRARLGAIEAKSGTVDK